VNFFKQAPISAILILLNLIVYGYEALYASSFIEIPTQALVEIGAIYAPFMLLDAQWWRLLSAVFMHGSMTHLLMNMFSLYLLGRDVERLFLPRHYLLLYGASALIGGLLSIWTHPLGVSIGASGAIFGIFGALLGFFAIYHKQMPHAKEMIRSLATLLGINLLLGVLVPSIDLSAHIGGLLTGLIGGALLAKNPRYVWGYLLILLCVAGGLLFEITS